MPPETLTLEDKAVVVWNDKVVLALGVVTNYFDIPGLPEFSYGIKSIGEAEELKRHLHEQIIDEGKPDLNYVIVGGGPTGIELAGSLGRYVHEVIRHHGLEDRKLHIDLVENAKHLMPRMPRSVGKAIERQLTSLGVKLYLGQAVHGQKPPSELSDGRQTHPQPYESNLDGRAGQQSVFLRPIISLLSPRKKVQVDEFLRARDAQDDSTFVIGDNAETIYSGMAQTAVYDAEFIAHNFVKTAEGKPKLAYRPKKPVYVTPAGSHWAAVEWGNVHIYGWLGWFLREAGDFVAFTDIESVAEAAGQWAHTLQHQDLCTVCGSVA